MNASDYIHYRVNQFLGLLHNIQDGSSYDSDEWQSVCEKFREIHGLLVQWTNWPLSMTQEQLTMMMSHGYGDLDLTANMLPALRQEERRLMNAFYSKSATLTSV
jgi:hypothetical protein